jgi:ABC-type glycerol-3-phosphate transport system substrate-binding protein
VPSAPANSLSRRAALAVLAAGAVGYAAFGPRGVRDPRAKGRTQLTYWEKWTGHEALAMQRVVDAFNESQSRIFVRLISMTTIEQRSLLAIAGKNPPEVIGLYSKLLPLFARAKAIVPLDSFAAEAGLSKATYADTIWRLCNVQTPAGSLFGLPNTCSSMALYMNVDALASAGLDASAPPGTIAELDGWSKLLTRRSGERIERLGFVQSEPGWWPYTWGPYFGGQLYDEATNKATANSEPNVRAYEWVQRTATELGVQRMMNFQSGLGSYASAEQPLLAGRVAMCLHGPFLVNVIKQYAPAFRFAVAPFPTEVSGLNASPTGLVEADVLTIPRGCKHPREAFEFIAFVQQQRVQEQLCIDHAKPTPLATSSTDYYARHPNPFIRVHEAIARSDKGFGTPATRAWNEYEAIFRRAWETDIWQVRTQARLALTRITEQAQVALDEAAAKERRAAGG